MRVAIALLLLLAASACKPRYSLDRSDEVGSARASTIDRVPVRGSIVTVIQNDGASTRGELLAVDERFVWVLPPNEDAVSVPRTFVRAVAVSGHTSARPQHVDALFQFARFPQGLPSDAPPAPPAPSPPATSVPPPPGSTVPPPPGAIAPEPVTAVPPPPGAEEETPPPPGAAEEVPPPPDPSVPIGPPGTETGAALSPPPRGR